MKSSLTYESNLFIPIERLIFFEKSNWLIFLVKGKIGILEIPTSTGQIDQVSLKDFPHKELVISHH